MPLIQITFPEETFHAEQEAQLAEEATEALLKLEGMAQNPKARMLTWTYLNKHPKTTGFVGGKPMHKPHYRFDVTVFENTLNDDRKARLTHELTECVLRLEGTDHNVLNAARVWVLFHEVADGNWGGAGQIYHLAELMKMMQS
jgi:phenylpyruvate tautomerase PptA (4-oxalocrotonate tautomerase family)